MGPSPSYYGNAALKKSLGMDGGRGANPFWVSFLITDQLASASLSFFSQSYPPLLMYSLSLFFSFATDDGLCKYNSKYLAKKTSFFVCFTVQYLHNEILFSLNITTNIPKQNYHQHSETGFPPTFRYRISTNIPKKHYHRHFIKKLPPTFQNVITIYVPPPSF